MPIALNHAMIRRALGDTLAHFDPSGQAPASSDLVLVGHSMGGVIARLMVSSTDQSLVQLAADHSRLTPQQIRRIDPMLRFEPFPNVSSAIFIAAPHPGHIGRGWTPGALDGGIYPLSHYGARRTRPYTGAQCGCQQP